MATPDPTTLTQTFHHTTSTHTFSIKWTSLGSPTSPPLIFIHGTPWSSLVWRPYALALSRKYNVYLFDNPGFGCSPLERRTSAPFTPRSAVETLDADLARQSEAFAALFKFWEDTGDWGGRRPHVVAHDHGGLMSLRAYLLHGCAYASLCLIDVVAIGPFGTPLFKSVGANPEAFEGLPDQAFGGLVEAYIRNAAYGDLNASTLEALKRPWVEGEGKKGFVRQLCQANVRSTEEVEGRYAKVGEEIPVKIIWGREDKWIPWETAGRLAEALGAKEVVVIEEAGHLIMYDQPAQLGVELAAWLGDN